MKKRVAFVILFVMMTITFVGVVDAAIHNPKSTSQCALDKEGKLVITKDCDPNSCGCLFHRIEEYVKEFFK